METRDEAVDAELDGDGDEGVSALNRFVNVIIATIFGSIFF